MRLIDRLKELEEQDGAGSKFQFKIDVIKDLAEEKLNGLVSRIHPDFTLHDYNHVKTVISNLDRFCDIMGLLSDENSSRLSKYEIFLLLAGAYLHDIGMILVEEKDKLRFIGTRDAAKRSMADLSRMIRKDHPERSMKYVVKNRDVLHISETDSRYIGTICFGHGDWNLADEKYSDQPDHTNIENGNTVVRICFLTALLQVADELDASCERAPDYIRKVLQDLSMDCISQFHWMKHYYTRTPQFGRQDIGIDKKVIIRLTLEVPDELHGIRIKTVLESRIRQEIDFVKPFLRRYCGWYFDLNPINVIINPGLESTPEEVFRAYFIGDEPVKILLIEDEEEWRKNFNKALGNEYSISYAHDEKSALDKIKNEGYNLIALDLYIPDKEGDYSKGVDVGFAVLRTLEEFCPDSIVVVITAAGKFDDSVRIKASGLITYPISKSQFYTDQENPPKKIIETIVKENLHLLKKEVT